MTCDFPRYVSNVTITFRLCWLFIACVCVCVVSSLRVAAFAAATSCSHYIRIIIRSLNAHRAFPSAPTRQAMYRETISFLSHFRATPLIFYNSRWRRRRTNRLAKRIYAFPLCFVEVRAFLFLHVTLKARECVVLGLSIGFKRILSFVYLVFN